MYAKKKIIFAYLLRGKGKIGGSMIEPKKVQLMTKLGMFEKKIDERASLQIVKYNKFDYIRFQLLKMIVSITIGILMILGIYVFYHSQYFLNHFTSIDYLSIGKKVLILYIILILISRILGGFFYSRKYTKARRKVKKYDHILHELRKYYHMQRGKEALSLDSRGYKDE